MQVSLDIQAISNTSYYKDSDFHKILLNVWTEQLLGEFILAKVVCLSVRVQGPRSIGTSEASLVYK